MIEPEVRPTQRGARAPLSAAGAKPRRAAGLAALLLLAAGCSMAGDPPRVLPTVSWNPGGPRGGDGTVNGAAGMGAGIGMPGTAGTPTPVGAGTGQPLPSAGTAGRDIPPTGGGAGNPPAVTGGTGGTRPPSDGGLPDFNAGTDPARNRVQAGQICARASAIQCAAEVHCCAAPAKTLEACKTELTKYCTEKSYLDKIANINASGYSSAQAEVVFNKLEEYSRNCDPSVVGWAAKPDGLRSIFQGTVAPGGQCKPTGIVPTYESFGAALASCTQSNTTACKFSGNGAPPSSPPNATCAPRAGAGGSCFVTTNCNDGLYCPNSQMNYSGGKCTAQKLVGATCTTDEECVTFTCRGAACVAPTVETAYCVSSTL